MIIDKSDDIVATSAGATFKRLGKNTKPYYPSEFSSDKTLGFKGDYSTKIIADTTIEDIDFDEVANLKRKLKTRNRESTLYLLDDLSFLKDLDLIKLVKNEIKLTVAGVLFVGSQEAIANFLPQAEILLLTYTEGKMEYSNRIDLKVPLVQAIDRIRQIFDDRNNIENVQVGLFKLEVKDYPTNVFQEALLNALTHRDYENNSSIIIKIYPSEIVIENPGSFPDGITSTNIISHPSTPRNKLIAETFQKLKYVQRSGQGVDIIFKDMLALGKSAPDYTIYPNAVSLTLRSRLDDLEFLKFITKEEERLGEFTVQEICILKYVKDNKTISISEAANIAQVNTQSITTVLNNLCQKKNIMQREKRNTYMFTHRVYAEFEDQIDYIKDKQFDEIQAEAMIIEYLKKNGYITRTDVEKLCGFSSTSSKRVLQKLRAQGLIELIGKGKASKYISK